MWEGGFQFTIPYGIREKKGRRLFPKLCLVVHSGRRFWNFFQTKFKIRNAQKFCRLIGSCFLSMTFKIMILKEPCRCKYKLLSGNDDKQFYAN